MPVPETITAFTRRLKTLIETDNPIVMLQGEISNLRIQPSGHHYFSLKDATAQISAVLFRGDALRLRVRPQDGMQVIATGNISLYEARGQYQIIVRHLEEDGVGRLQRRFEELKLRLAKEGLFDPQKRKSLPALPQTVGILTSPSGAAIQDILRILTRRGWLGHIVIFPAKVQGTEAAYELAEQIRAANALPTEGSLPRPDLLVLTRGGGSIEDLWPFNEERLVRAIAASDIPVISAVGHETDVTLSDFAADLRAETPSAAAELLSSSYLAQSERCERNATAFSRECALMFSKLHERLSSLQNHLRLLSPSKQIESRHLNLDDLRNRLHSGTAASLRKKQHLLSHATLLFSRATPAHHIRLQSQRLLSLYKRLQATSPDNILKRGYAIVRTSEGKPLTSLRQAIPHTAFRIQFADGDLSVRREDGKSAPGQAEVL